MHIQLERMTESEREWLWDPSLPPRVQLSFPGRRLCQWRFLLPFRKPHYLPNEAGLQLVDDTCTVLDSHCSDPQ